MFTDDYGHMLCPIAQTAPPCKVPAGREWSKEGMGLLGRRSLIYDRERRAINDGRANAIMLRKWAV